jgi:hypothetical protein
MNEQLQKTLQLADHPCLTTIKGLYAYPFVRPVSALEGYEYKAGPWAVTLFNVKPGDLDPDDPATRQVTIQFCPFCGASLFPEPEPEKALKAEPTQEVSSEEAAAKGPVRAAAKPPAGKP